MLTGVFGRCNRGRGGLNLISNCHGSMVRLWGGGGWVGVGVFRNIQFSAEVVVGGLLVCLVRICWSVFVV